MRLASLTWASDMALLLGAAEETKIELAAWCVSELNEDNIEDCIQSLNSAEAVLLHPCQQDCLFDRVVEKIDKRLPVISFGLDPALWSFSNVSAKIVSAVNAFPIGTRPFSGIEYVFTTLFYETYSNGTVQDFLLIPF